MSETMRTLMATSAEQTPEPAEREAGAGELEAKTGRPVYPASITPAGGKLYFLTRGPDKQLGRATLDADEPRVELLPMDHDNAATLRAELPFLAPSLVGLDTSLGLGDRLGLATPGHIRAVRGTGLAPVLAQQSIREMERTHRTPEDVMDAATWGALQEGYRDGFGSDADHLKTPDDVAVTAAAGFTMFTVDPGDHVTEAADEMDRAALDDALDAVPWDRLETTREETESTYTDSTFAFGGFELDCSGAAVARAAVKYGAAVAHTVEMARHVASTMAPRPFEIEMSVDETETPTSPVEHFYVASELRRLGVEVVSLAPRFVGRFEKGVDYIGDLGELEGAFRWHVAIARELGPYKLSIHSGSDKFSVYEVAAKVAGGLVHVKTAGTSYLEAVRAIAQVEPDLFREILAFAFERWDEDRATYHVSADPAKARRPEALADDELPDALDQFDTRQILHVTFGSVLTSRADGGYRFRDRFYAALRGHEEEHYAALERHLGKHAAPFAAG
ncbi:MAG: tagaturonate epimerase family protein [Planctomycetota bacterium]